MTLASIPLFFILMILIFFVSKETVNQLFYFLRRVIHNEKRVLKIVCGIFFPGTVLHELAHYFVAIATMHHVVAISIFPKFEKDQIKLGSVLYVKKDIIRSILVGIAPIFAGLAFFWFIGAFHIFPSENIFLSIGLGYLVFAVSSTMFSSKQDLIDIVFILPLLLVAAFIIYIFNIRIDELLQNQTVLTGISKFLEQIDIFLFFSLVIHISLIIVLKIVTITSIKK